MRVGISLTTQHTFQNPPREIARWLIERAAAARQSGLDSLFVGDHHSTPEPYVQNVPLLGRLLAEWGDKPAGCLFLLPLWNPVLVAEQVGTLAAIAKGRFVLQVGLGYGEPQFAAMGANFKTRPSAFEESLNIIRRLLAGETVSSDGRFKVTKAQVALRPTEPVEVCVGATADPAIDRAARLGDGWLVTPNIAPDGAAKMAGYYLERCKAYGRTPTTVGLRRDLYVGESSAEAQEVKAAAVARGYRGFDPATLIAGTVDEVVAALRPFAPMGYTDVLVRHLTTDQGKILASLKRLAEVRAALA